MRTVVRVVACVASALGIAACNPWVEGQYYREGIGTTLYRSDLPDATRVLDLYIDYICRQADLSPPQAEFCAPPQISPAWALFVQAGMNDIDRRCDAYLAWLDNKKRSANPILQQISDTRSVTEAIMRIAGAGADSIVITGLAFGLAASTFTNINSRLVLEVDHTTVQTVVLTTQKKYRLWIRGEIIDNKPAAIHALRSYLRLCMPFTIETEINMTATIVQRGGAAAIAAIERDPLVNPATVGVAVRQGPVGRPVIRSTEPLPKTAALPPPQTILNPETDVERTISLGVGKAFQKTLCQPETGDFDATTRMALRDFYSAVLYPTDANAPDSVRTDADLRRLRDARTAFPSCKGAGLLTPYEVGVFLVNGAEQIRSWLAAASRVAQLPVPPALSAPTTGAGMNGAMREAVRALRAKYNLSGQPVIDRAFFVQLKNAIER
jgi:hypothetical protein